MTENNSKHLILLSISNYKFYISSYKVSRSTKILDIPTFKDQQKCCYMGYGHEQMQVKALIDQSRLYETHFMLNSLKSSEMRNVTIEGKALGQYMLTDYEICGSEDNYIYEVSISMCRP